MSLERWWDNADRWKPKKWVEESVSVSHDNDDDADDDDDDDWGGEGEEEEEGKEGLR